MAVRRSHFVCLVCPIGCEIDVVHEGSTILSMEGEKCDRSYEFVTQELIEPMRTLTTTVRIRGARWSVIPVRTDSSVPRRLFSRIMRQLKHIELEAPVQILDVVVANVAGTHANIIATRSMRREL